MVSNLFISPPFGNYVSLYDTTPIRGSFTLLPRDGLVKQIINTLHYSWVHGGWVNKIGLRNNGLDWAIVTHNNRSICGIAIMNEKEIPQIVEKIPKDMNIELNLSCPNVKKDKVCSGLETFINNQRRWCIIKLSPHTTTNEIDNFYKIGFRQFHCCNTIPVPEGGLSGPKIKPYASKLISYISRNYSDTEIIAGGGVREMDDISDYKKCGANHFAISSVLFNPIQFGMLYAGWLGRKK